MRSPSWAAMARPRVRSWRPARWYGRWRVEFVSRLFPSDGGAYAGPLPEPLGPPPLRIGIAPVPPIAAVAAVAAVIVDGDSGAVLFEKNAHRPLPPASLTKIATAILTVEQGGLDAVIEVDVDSGKLTGSSLMGLRPGDRFSVRDLLYGLMLASGNDAALALGRELAGNDAGFVVALNALLARIGLRDSTLTNPHGLDAAGHRASAYDLAMLSRYGTTYAAFREIVPTVLRQVKDPGYFVKRKLPTPTVPASANVAAKTIVSTSQPDAEG